MNDLKNLATINLIHATSSRIVTRFIENNHSTHHYTTKISTFN